MTLETRCSQALLEAFYFRLIGTDFDLNRNSPKAKDRHAGYFRDSTQSTHPCRQMNALPNECPTKSSLNLAFNSPAYHLDYRIQRDERGRQRFSKESFVRFFPADYDWDPKMSETHNACNQMAGALHHLLLLF